MLMLPGIFRIFMILPIFLLFIGFIALIVFLFKLCCKRSCLAFIVALVLLLLFAASFLHVPRLRLGRRLGKLLCKIYARQYIHACRFNQLHLLVIKCDERKVLVTIQDTDRMGFKGDHHGGPPEAFRLFHDLTKKCLVSNVNTVEVADCDHSIVEWSDDLSKICDEFHGY